MKKTRKQVDKSAPAQDLSRAPDPFAKARDVVAAHQNGLVAEIVQNLKAVLMATRVHSVTSFKPDRCLACDTPHNRGICVAKNRGGVFGPCPHHEAVKLLERLGVAFP